MQKNTAELPVDLGEKFLNVHQLAAYLNISPKTIYNWGPLGLGPTRIKIGGNIRFRIADVDQWVESNAKAQEA